MTRPAAADAAARSAPERLRYYIYLIIRLYYYISTTMICPNRVSVVVDIVLQQSNEPVDFLIILYIVISAFITDMPSVVARGERLRH